MQSNVTRLVPLNLAALVAATTLCAARAGAVPFTVSYTDGGSWNAVYAQGFTPSVSPSPNPGSAAGNTVYLNQFQFFKSGSPNAASNVRLAILNNIFANLQGLTTSSPAVVGLSNNTVADPGAIATGSPIAFDFPSLPLTYGSNYAAVFVNLGAGGALTPVQVPALVANYVETPPGSGTYLPGTSYGTTADFALAVSNFFNTNEFGSFFSTFSGGGDANFVASLNTEIPEPATISLALLGAAPALARRRRR